MTGEELKNFTWGEISNLTWGQAILNKFSLLDPKYKLPTETRKKLLEICEIAELSGYISSSEIQTLRSQPLESVKDTMDWVLRVYSLITLTKDLVAFFSNPQIIECLKNVGEWISSVMPSIKL